jgi:hypothetical protein
MVISILGEGKNHEKHKCRKKETLNDKNVDMDHSMVVVVYRVCASERRGMRGVRGSTTHHPQ